MRSRFRSSFLRDVRKLRERRVRRAVHDAIESIEKANAPSEIPNLKGLSGSRSIYRLRVGDYRIGIAMEDDVVEFVRCLHRRDIYRYFP